MWRDVCIIMHTVKMSRRQHIKGLVTPGNRKLNGGQTDKKCADFGYPVTKFISSAARGCCNRYMGHRRQAMTA